LVLSGAAVGLHIHYHHRIKPTAGFGKSANPKPASGSGDQPTTASTVNASGTLSMLLSSESGFEVG
jgi:hypothetical protein